MNEALPTGVWYEAPRKRWRVRLYNGRQRIWISYHRSQEEALAAYEKASRIQFVTRPGNLPRGIWHDAERKRWRVRLYIRDHCVWRSYHIELADALKAYDLAVAAQKQARRPKQKPAQTSPPPHTVFDLFRSAT